MLQDQLRQAVVDRAPVVVRRQRLQGRVRRLDPQFQFAPVSQVENAAGQRLAGQVHPGQEVGNLRHRFLRRRQPDPRWPLLGHVIQPSQRQRQVRTPLVAHDRVNLVEDDRANRAQDLPRLLRRQHQVERLRRRDQDLRRPLDDRPPLGLRRVAGAQPHADARQRDPALLRQLPDLGQRLLEIAADVVRKRLQRRDVQDPHLVRQLAPLSSPSRIRSSIPARNAVSVLPDPVGAAIRQSSPVRIAGQPSSCANVGAPKRPQTSPAPAGGIRRAPRAALWTGSYVPHRNLSRVVSQCRQ